MREALPMMVQWMRLYAMACRAWRPFMVSHVGVPSRMYVGMCARGYGSWEHVLGILIPWNTFMEV